MSETIELTYGNSKAVVSLRGGWVESYMDNKQDVLFPKHVFELEDGSKKVRGGSHICFPNFGPGGDSGLIQHGFARDMLWALENQTSSAVHLVLDIVEGEYAGVRLGLEYQLSEVGLVMRLTVNNNAANVVPISPGFHPYFKTSAKQTAVDQEVYEHVNLHEPTFLGDRATTLESDQAVYGLNTEGLSEWVLWTDELGDYVCLEPTYAGFAFVSGEGVYLLQPGKKWSGSLRISRPISKV